MAISEFTKKALAMNTPAKKVSSFTQSAVDSYDVVFESKKFEIPKYTKPGLNTDLKISQAPPPTFSQKIDAFLEPLRSKLEGIPLIGRRPIKETADEESLINTYYATIAKRVRGIEISPEENQLAKEGQKIEVARIGDMAINFSGSIGGPGKLRDVIISTKTTQRAKEVVKTLGFADDVAEGFSSKIVNANTKKQANQVIEELFTKPIQQAVVVPVKVLPQAQKATSVASKVDDTVGPLAQEARKYKSAEEFVSGVKKNYNFTDDLGSRVNIKIKGDTADIYGMYAKEKGTNLYGRVIEDLKNRGVKTINVTLQSVDSEGAINSLVKKGILEKPRGVDPRVPGGRPRTFDIVGTKTKSQLTDIYNQATKKTIKTKSPKEQLAEREQAKIARAQEKLKRESLTFYEGNLENQYQSFKQLKVKDAEDIVQLKTKNNLGTEIDNMLYSGQDSQLNSDDVFDMFKARYEKERVPLPKIPRETKAIVREEVRQKARVIQKEMMDKVKTAYDKKVSAIKDNKEILQRRRIFIRAVQKQFGLSDGDLKSITQRDIRLMTNEEFHIFLDNIRAKSEQFAIQSQVRNELMAQIQEKELNVEPLREVLKLPPISKMTTAQLQEFDKILQSYMKGDVFLSKRKLETIERTELAGIKTYREAREILAKKLGIRPDELNNIKIGEFDRFKGHSALAEKDPFFRMMVEETAKLRLIREAEYLEIEQKINALARKIKTTLGQKLIPQQKNIRAWFEAKDKATVQLTKEEADVVKVMQEEWIKARDYLIKIKAMEKGRKSENYFTHVRRGILEAAKEDGVIQAAKEVFEQYKFDEQVFNILDTQTGDVLALDKFFRFALQRTGGLKPTENIVGAFLNYMKTFKKKQALDEMVPLIDIYAHALTPKGTTKTGLLLHGDLVRFTKEWLNTQKGRRITLIAKQGGKIDWALRAGRTFTTLLDLGFNIPVTVVTQVGEQAVQYQLLGKVNFIKAKIRSLMPRGKRVVAKYRNVIGKNPWTQLIEPMRSIGNRLGEGMFVAFRDANVRRNRNVLLGLMTKEEWASETLSPERLAQIQIFTGRYGVVDGAGSIIGATPEAGVATQYKSWAIPIVGAQLRNAIYMAKFFASRGAKESVRGKRALLETYRMLELGAFVTIIGYWALNEDDDSFIGKLKLRAYQEAMTLFGAAPAIFSVPRMATFLVDFAANLKSIMLLEKYKTSQFGEYKAGDFKGVNRLLEQLSPRAIDQFQGTQVKTLDDVKKEIKSEIESGNLSVAAAKEKFISEVKKLEAAEKKVRFAMPPNEYKADLKERIISKEITVAEAKEEYVDYAEANVDSFESENEGSFIDKIVLHGKAIGTDPVTAFIFLFQGETIRKIENGTIIVERMSLEESNQERKERGATKELVLDHTLPLQLGGGNSKENLKLVSVEEWEEYTEVENYLGDKLRAGLITKKEAQRLILDFKKGKIKREDIMK